MAVIFELLDKNLHDRSNFDCGEESLNIFLKEKANKEQKIGFSKTYVAINPSNEKEILGYYSLSSGHVSINDLPFKMKEKLPRYANAPTLMIGRLARDKYKSPKGFGRSLIKDALKKAIENNAGVYAIEVQAINESVVSFYSTYGFIPFNQNPMNLFLPITTVIELFHEKRVHENVLI